MSQSPKKTSTIQFSLVPEFSWWKSKDERRLLCVIEVRGRGQGNDYVNTDVALIEVGIPGKKYVPYAKFVEQIHLGNMIQVHFFDSTPLVRFYTQRMSYL